MRFLWGFFLSTIRINNYQNAIKYSNFRSIDHFKLYQTNTNDQNQNQNKHVDKIFNDVNKIDDDDIMIENCLILIESKFLKTLPFEFLSSYRFMMEQLVPRTSLIALTLHVMLLIPVLRYIKVVLHLSLYPYIYMGPLVFGLPYLFFWLWDNSTTDISGSSSYSEEGKNSYNVFPLSLLDNYLNIYIKEEQQSARVYLREESDRVMNILREEVQTITGNNNNNRYSDGDRNSNRNSNGNGSSTDDAYRSLQAHLESDPLSRRLSYARLLDKIDADALWTQIMSIKALPSTRSGSGSSSEGRDGDSGSSRRSKGWMNYPSSSSSSSSSSSRKSGGSSYDSTLPTLSSMNMNNANPVVLRSSGSSSGGSTNDNNNIMDAARQIKRAAEREGVSIDALKKIKAALDIDVNDSIIDSDDDDDVTVM